VSFGAAGGVCRRALALAGALAACGTPPARREPPEPPLRVWTPGLVHWSGERRDLGLEIENGTARTLQVERPSPRRARVVVFSGSGPDRVCGQEADVGGPAGEATPIGPGGGLAVRVDLSQACGALPPGEYRYEASYEAPAIGSGPTVRLRPSHGHVVVDAGPPSPARGGLGSGEKATEGPGREDVGSPPRGR
jgi:hypothetical protein